jgi:hypothetical protein
MSLPAGRFRGMSLGVGGHDQIPDYIRQFYCVRDARLRPPGWTKRPIHERRHIVRDEDRRAFGYRLLERSEIPDFRDRLDNPVVVVRISRYERRDGVESWCYIGVITQANNRRMGTP